MTRDDIFTFLTDHRDFSLSTVDNGKPRVRTLWLHKANESGIYFMVGKLKSVYFQLCLNPEVELCFHNDKKQIRIQGTVENLDKDNDLKEEVLQARPFMKEWIEDKGLKYMAVFRIVHGVATVWSRDNEFLPPERMTL